MPRFLTKGEWVFSHLCFVLGLIFVSLTIWLYTPGIALPLIGGLWLLSGGFCSMAVALFERLKRIEEKLEKPQRA